MIACGGDHMFAVLSNDKVFGWGRNDEGQLGLGILSESIKRP
jgi:alpha-tubulin suppressor-like RCC1 family protein